MRVHTVCLYVCLCVSVKGVCVMDLCACMMSECVVYVYLATKDGTIVYSASSSGVAGT